MLRVGFQTKGMLQGFHEENILLETNETTVISVASCKAAELAMLGLQKEANSIMCVVGKHAIVKCDHDLRLEHFWNESNTPRPRSIATPSENAGHSEEDRLNELRKTALRGQKFIPDWSLTEESFHEVSKLVETLKEGKSARVADATYGHLAQQLSDAYTVLLSIAIHLGWEEKAAELMATIAARIHADMQSQCLGITQGIWRKYMLSGRLRDALGVDLKALRKYARFVRDTTERRLKDGPLPPGSLYEDWTIRQIVEEIDQNTVAGMRNQSKDAVIFTDASHFFNGAIPSTIKREPPTAEQIRGAESRIGRAMPADMKEFYSVTDGFLLVKCAAHPPDFEVKFSTFAEVSLEEEDWMEDYTFDLVRDLDLLGVSWPGVIGGGIRFYHDTDYPAYTWILGADVIAKAKTALRELYEEESEEGKREIDRKIISQYGSREVLDGISESCVFEQPWGEVDNRTYPTFRHYLETIAVRTRDPEERSPLKTKFVNAEYAESCPK